MKNFQVLLLTLLLCFNTISQEYINIDNSVKIGYKKVRDSPKIFNAHDKVKFDRDSPYLKIQVICKIRPIDNKPFDPNKFSLLDTNNRFRYKLIDYHGIRTLRIVQGGGIIQKKIYNSKGKQIYKSAYKPEIKDTFYDFTFDGYKTIACEVNFGTKKEPITSIIYFHHTTFKKFTAQLYFGIYKQTEKPTNFELYYGDVKIADVKL